MSGTRIKVLLVTDNPGDTGLIRTLVTEMNGKAFALEGVHGLPSARERLVKGGIDVVQLALLSSDRRPPDTFLTVNTYVPDIPIVV